MPAGHLYTQTLCRAVHTQHLTVYHRISLAPIDFSSLPVLHFSTCRFMYSSTNSSAIYFLPVRALHITVQIPVRFISLPVHAMHITVQIPAQFISLPVHFHAELCVSVQADFVNVLLSCLRYKWRQREKCEYLTFGFSGGHFSSFSIP